MISPIPEGYNQVSPYLMVKSIEDMIRFLVDVFEAEILEQKLGSDGSVQHGEVRIGDSVIMMGKARDNYKAMESMVHIYLADVDSVYEHALKAGATSLMEPTDQSYGNRESGVRGPLGNQWWIASQIAER